MPSCYLEGCTSGYGGKRTHLFTCPKVDSVREQWLINVPLRSDRPWDFETCYLCYLHFEDKYIVKESKVFMNDEVVARQNRKRWILTKDAVPTKFANSVPKYFNKKAAKREAPCPRDAPIQCKQQKNVQQDNNVSENNVTLEEQNFQHAQQFDFESVILPNKQWFMRENSNCEDDSKPFLLVYLFGEQISDTRMSIKRCLQLYKDNSICAQIDGNIVPIMHNVPNNAEELNEALVEFASLKQCAGVSGYGDVTSCKLGNHSNGIWFSKKCNVIVPDHGHGICTRCLDLVKPLRTAKYQLPNRNTARTKKTPEHLPRQSEREKYNKLNHCYQRSLRPKRQSRKKKKGN